MTHGLSSAVYVNDLIAPYVLTFFCIMRMLFPFIKYILRKPQNSAVDTLQY